MALSFEHCLVKYSAAALTATYLATTTCSITLSFVAAVSNVEISLGHHCLPRDLAAPYKAETLNSLTCHHTQTRGKCIQ